MKAQSISIKLCDGKYETSEVYNYGNYYYMFKTLSNCYNNFTKVKDLIEQGNMLYLAHSLHDKQYSIFSSSSSFYNHIFKYRHSINGYLFVYNRWYFIYLNSDDHLSKRQIPKFTNNCWLNKYIRMIHKRYSKHRMISKLKKLKLVNYSRVHIDQLLYKIIRIISILSFVYNNEYFLKSFLYSKYEVNGFINNKKNIHIFNITYIQFINRTREKMGLKLLKLPKYNNSHYVIVKHQYHSPKNSKNFIKGITNSKDTRPHFFVKRFMNTIRQHCRFNYCIHMKNLTTSNVLFNLNHFLISFNKENRLISKLENKMKGNGLENQVSELVLHSFPSRHYLKNGELAFRRSDINFDIDLSVINDMYINIYKYYKDYVIKELSYADFKHFIVNLLYNQINKNCMNLDVNNLFVKIKHKLIQIKTQSLPTYSCIIPIFGIKISHKIELDNINVFPFSYRNKILKDICFDNSIFTLQNKLPFVVINLKMVGVHTSIQQSEVLLWSFIDSLITCYGNIIRFLCKYYPSHFMVNSIYNVKNIGIGNPYTPPLTRDGNIIGNEIITDLRSNNNFTSTYSIHDQYSLFPNKKLNANKLLSLPFSICMSPFTSLPIKDVSYDKLKKTCTMKNYVNRIIRIQYIGLRKKLTNLNKRFIDENRLVAEGMRSQLPSTKLLKFMTSIESIMKLNDGNKKDFDVKSSEIIKRVSKLIKGNRKDSNIWKEMRHLYKLRNNVAHGSIPLITKLDIKSIFCISEDVLSYVWVFYIRTSKTSTELLNYVSK